MNKSKIVLFSSMDNIGQTDGGVSKKVNDWLDRNEVEITHVLQTQSETACPTVVNYTITIIYRDLLK